MKLVIRYMAASVWVHRGAAAQVCARTNFPSGRASRSPRPRRLQRRWRRVYAGRHVVSRRASWLWPNVLARASFRST